MAIAATLATTPPAMAAPKTILKAAGRAVTTVVNTILCGAGIPTKATGIDGDFYIDTKNANLYGPKTKGVWKIATSLKQSDPKSVSNTVGEQVVIGAAGPQGEKGDKGATGNTGAAGSAGSPGAAGAKGASGIDGAAGLPGAAGSAGAKGDAGVAGASGSTGSPGSAGAKGDAGTAGAKGDTGTTGAKGDAGTAGAKGDTGTTGAKGDTGTTGAKGDTGTTGAAGVSVSKFSGFSFITFSTGINGNNLTSNFITITETGNYTFEVLASALISNDENLNFSGEIVSGGVPIDAQYSISSAAVLGVSPTLSRRYSILVSGVASNVAVGTSFGIKITLITSAQSPMSISFGGRALINKVGSIG